MASLDDAVNLRGLREMAGHSQQSLADALGVHVRTVSRWERGVVPVPEDVLDWLADALDDQRGLVDRALDIVERLGGTGAVRINYFRSQDEYDATHDDGGNYGEINAAARQVTAHLLMLGVPFAFVHEDAEVTIGWEREPIHSTNP